MKKLVLISTIFIFFLLGFLAHQNTYPIALVVPHHDFVKNERVEFLQTISKLRKDIDTVFLVGPDHYSKRQSLIKYTDKSWDLSLGILHSKKVEGLDNLAVKDNFSLSSDHAIVNILPDIQMMWSSAKVVPILIGEAVSVEQVDGLIKLISKECNKKCLLIASVDFSHYVPWNLADIHDVKTINDLKNHSVDGTFKNEVDSPLSLYILSQFSQRKNAYRFLTLNHTNSSKIAGTNMPDSTSHLFGYYSPGKIIHNSSSSKSYSIANNKGLSQYKKGNRYLFGTDEVDLNIMGKKCFSENFCIISSEEESALRCEDGINNLYLGNKMLLGILRSDDFIYVSSHSYILDDNLNFQNPQDNQNQLESLYKNLCPESFDTDLENGIIYTYRI